MSFLAPFYALAGLAIAIPIVLHLIRKEPKKHQVFSSLMFLDAAPPRLTSARKIDQWFLLLLRSLAIILLALAFSRPYWNVPIATERQASGISRMLLIDTSASMRREGVWEAAINRANRIISESNPVDTLSVYAFDTTLRPLHSLESSLESVLSQRQENAKIAIRDLKPTWKHTDLGLALSAAADLLQGGQMSSASAQIADSEIVVVTDFQQGTQLDKLAEYNWPDSIRLRIERIDGKSTNNARASVLSLDRLSGSLETQKVATANSDAEKFTAEKSTADKSSSVNSSPKNFKALITNQSAGDIENSKEVFELSWLDDKQKSIESTKTVATVPLNSSLVVSVPEPPQGATALKLSGDLAEFDNAYYLTPLIKSDLSLICIDDYARKPEESLSYFLKQLPLSTPLKNVSFLPRNPDEEKNLPTPESTPLVVASHQATAKDLTALREFLDQGGNVLWVWDAPESNAAIAYVEGLKILLHDEALKDIGLVSEAKLKQYAMLEQIDFQHPLFADLSDSKFNDYSKIRFWSHRSIELNEPESTNEKDSENGHWDVLSRFDDGSPAIVNRSQGAGKLWIMLAGWQPKESQLAVSSKFVPLIASLFRIASPDGDVKANYRVGDILQLQPHESLSDPLGKLVSGEGLSVSLQEPGVFKITGENAKSTPVAVNLHESESLTAPSDLVRLEQFGIVVSEKPKQETLETASQHLRAVELESQQGWWRWMIVGVLAMVGLESVFCVSKGV